MERYTAFTKARNKARFFRVWHLPWQQQAVEIDVTERSLLETNWEFFRQAQLAGANYSPGLKEVWMVTVLLRKPVKPCVSLCETGNLRKTQPCH